MCKDLLFLHRIYREISDKFLLLSMTPSFHTAGQVPDHRIEPARLHHTGKLPLPVTSRAHYRIATIP